MSLTVHLNSIRGFNDNHDREGRLAIVNSQLAAVFVRLDGEEHPEDLRGKWFLEAGFGRWAMFHPPVFSDLDEAQRGALEQLSFSGHRR